MEQWNYTWDDFRQFEHPLATQEYEFRLGTYHGTMVPQPYLQDQYFESRLSFIEEVAAHLQKSLVDDAEQWRESQERSAKIDKLIEQIQVNKLFEHDQELTNQQPCEFFDPNPLLVNHEFSLKEDGNREEELVLPGIGLGDYDTVLSRSNKGVDKEVGGEENVPSGEQVLEGYRENALEPRCNAAEKKKKKKKKRLMMEVFDIFKGADVNFPLLDLISQVPAYAKFVRNLCKHKKKLQDGEKFVLKEEVSAIIQRKVSPGIHDPTSFVIGCTIGEHFFKGALMDMGTSINIMPLATFRKLAIGSLQPTSISVQLADETFRMPLGIVEDVLIRVDKFILPADFVILDIDEDPEIENGLPIILGRPFMAMAGAKINVQKGAVKLKVLGEKVKLQVLQPAFPQNVIKEALSTNLVKGNQAKSERTFGPLNPPKPLIQDAPLPVIAEHMQQEQPFMEDDDDDMFEDFVNSYVHNDIDSAASTSVPELDSVSTPLPVHKTETSFACVPPELDMDPHFMGQQSSSFEQAHQLNEFESPQLQEVVKPTSTINECARGIPSTPYIPPHRRGLLPTPYFHPHEHRLSSSFESFKMTSPPSSEVQLEAIQCLGELMGIGVNRMKTYECHPYLSYYGGRKMCYAPP
ncbi:hypothetical protein M0R45_019582 [Rubus argutus]|uniref:Uncharacterized protein n=1 Tax=Rubus argutus TaxID=59490 RepID=A0AAW1X5R9_RUBAR